MNELDDDLDDGFEKEMRFVDNLLGWTGIIGLAILLLFWWG
jgi:hypothetical protein